MSKSTEETLTELRKNWRFVLSERLLQLLNEHDAATVDGITSGAEHMHSAYKDIEQLFDQELAKRVEENSRIMVAGKEVSFSHTAVNGDMHMFIDGYHNPDVCPECIQPGLLVVTLNNQTEERGNKK